MSELDKDKVLDDFSKAYQASEGKKPKIEANNGWYSVDGGKNMRLAQLDEWTDELKKSAKGKSGSGSKAASKPAPKRTAKSGSKAKSSGKADSKKSTKNTGKSKSSDKSKSSNNSGQTAAELWKQHLAEQAGDCRLPRGVD